METSGVKWSMVNGGLASNRCSVGSSYCHTAGRLDSETKVEQFTIDVPDGSVFLIQITKLKGEGE